jgi:arsenate reductase-like glutaredoxin family protein
MVSASHHSPNHEGHEDNFVEADKKKKKTSCADYLKRFDQLIMRPILIHKYEKDSNARA